MIAAERKLDDLHAETRVVAETDAKRHAQSLFDALPAHIPSRQADKETYLRYMTSTYTYKCLHVCLQYTYSLATGSQG